MTKFVEELRISRLSSDQIERMCEIAEETARRYIISRVNRGISDLTITVDLEGTETLTVNIDVEVKLSPLSKNINVEDLTRDSVKAAFEAIEKYLREC